MVESETAIRRIVESSVEGFAQGFSWRHINEKNNPNGTLNMKIHNVFIAVLGKELQYYTALVRSFDSALGNMLEKMAINIAKLFYDVRNEVKGPLYPEQTSIIAELLEGYKNSQNPIKPDLAHYDKIKQAKTTSIQKIKRHVSDYYLINKSDNIHHLIELKIGGDLDNKKARSEKEAIFEQYAILANTLDDQAIIKCHFATAYNRFGEDKSWNQGRVLQFFSKDELLIGKDFWNFICNSDNGYNVVIDQYKKSSILIKSALDEIKKEYLNDR